MKATKKKNHNSSVKSKKNLDAKHSSASAKRDAKPAFRKQTPGKHAGSHAKTNVKPGAKAKVKSPEKHGKYGPASKHKRFHAEGDIPFDHKRFSADLKNHPIRVVALGGLGEIGMNCLVIEHADDMIVIDCGIYFSDYDHLGVECEIPDFSYITSRKDKISAVILTHGHEDHIGALPLLIKAGVRAPVYASHFTSLLVRERLTEFRQTDEVKLIRFEMGQKIRLKNFDVTPVSVNHSIIDAAALIIDTAYGKIIHTGDFRIEPDPFYGSAFDSTPFRQAGDDGVFLLLSDSTNVERDEPSKSEATVMKGFERIFNEAEGRVLVSMFSSNVARMGQLFELAYKMDKRVAVSGRSMEQNIRLGIERGLLKHAESTLVDLRTIDRYPRDRVIIMSTGSQAEARSALTRIARREHSTIDLGKDDLVVLSSKFIPGNEKAIGRMINNLFRLGANVIYDALEEVHVSGHATRPELKKMLEWTRPRNFVPIHGEYRHLVHHSKLALEVGLDDKHILVAQNGDVIDVTPKELKIVQKLDEARILLQNREGMDVSKLVIKDRRNLAETGVVISVVVRNYESLKSMASPEIIARGLAHESREPELLDDAQRIVDGILRRYESTLLKSGSNAALSFDLQETIRIELRRYFNEELGQKPLVLPVIIDV